MYQEYIMGLPLVYLYLIWIQAGFNHAVGLTNDAYIQTRKLGWWEARNKCAQDGNTDLFVPLGEFHVPPDSQIDTHYWVGGAEMSQWRWTDNSPLFTLMGQYGIPNVAENRTIHGNSALECYRQCRDAQFGLSGSKCYCFDRVNLGKKFDGTANIESCPGNKDEFCGTQSLISVYKIDIFFFIDGDYRCAYMQRKTFRGQRYIAVVPGACQSSYYGVCVDGGTDEPSCYDDSRTFLRCEADLCVTCWDSTWSSSNQSCSLVKLTSSRQNDLKYFLKGVKYWTGLHKQVTKSWISGKEIDDNFEVLTDHTDPGPRCLALTLSPTDWTAHWIPCSVQLQSLCAIKQNKSDDGGSDSSMLPERSALTSPEPHRTSGMPFQATVHTSTVTSETGGKISTGQRVGGDDAIPVQKGESVGTIVGVVMGVIILVAVIVLIILSRRKGKFCFKKSDGNKYDHTFAMDNVAYMSPNSLHNDDIIHENSRPGYVGKAANQSPGNDVKTLKSEDIDDYDSTTAVVKNTIDTDYLYNHLGADDDNYDTAGVHRIRNVQNNPYNHTDNRVGVRQSMADNTQDTYNHTERRVGAQQPLADNTQDTYNRIGDNHAEREDDSHDTYNNIGVALGSVESAPGVEQCYNHLMTEVDNDYDTTRPVVDIVQNDTYNHTASLGESQGTDADVNLSVTGCTDENSTDYYNL